MLLAALCLVGIATFAAAAPPLVIRDGMMFDSLAGRMVPFGTIVIEGDRITTITRSGDTFTAPPGAQVLDARGKFLIPGLIDAHVHLVHILRNLQITADELFPLFLAHGVTTLRDVGDEVGAQQRLAGISEAHPESAPRIFLGSPLVDANPPYHPLISMPITDPARVPAFVKEMSALGVQTFKIYVGTERAVGQVVIQEAHRRGRWATAHLAWGYRAQDAVADGIDSLEHVGSILEFILPPETPRWPPPVERAGISAEALAALERQILEVKAQLDLAAPRVTAMLDALVRHKVAVSPTLVVYRNWMLLRDQPEVLQHPDLRQVPARLRDGWLLSATHAKMDPATAELRRQQFVKLQELTGRMHRAGVELLAGTDTPVQFCPPGLAMHQELELMVQSGLTPAEVLTAATRNNARTLNQAERLGRIAPGWLADIVFLDADPLQDIRNTRRISRVIRSGVMSEPDALRRMVPTK